MQFIDVKNVIGVMGTFNKIKYKIGHKNNGENQLIYLENNIQIFVFSIRKKKKDNGYCKIHFCPDIKMVSDKSGIFNCFQKQTKIRKGNNCG